MYSSLTSSQYLIGTKGALFINSGQMVLPPPPPQDVKSYSSSEIPRRQQHGNPFSSVSTPVLFSPLFPVRFATLARRHSRMNTTSPLGTW